MLLEVFADSIISGSTLVSGFVYFGISIGASEISESEFYFFNS